MQLHLLAPIQPLREKVLGLQGLVKTGGEKKSFFFFKSPRIPAFISVLAFVESFSCLPKKRGANFIHFFSIIFVVLILRRTFLEVFT